MTGVPLPAPTPTFVVRVNLTVEIPYFDDQPPGIRDAHEDVFAALRQEKKLPDLTRLHGYITTRVRTAKEVIADQRRAANRKKERY